MNRFCFVVVFFCTIFFSLSTFAQDGGLKDKIKKDAPKVRINIPFVGEITLGKKSRSGAVLPVYNNCAHLVIVLYSSDTKKHRDGELIQLFPADTAFLERSSFFESQTRIEILLTARAFLFNASDTRSTFTPTASNYYGATGIRVSVTSNGLSQSLWELKPSSFTRAAGCTSQFSDGERTTVIDNPFQSSTVKIPRRLAGGILLTHIVNNSLNETMEVTSNHSTGSLHLPPATLLYLPIDNAVGRSYAVTFVFRFFSKNGGLLPQKTRTISVTVPSSGISAETLVVTP